MYVHMNYFLKAHYHT